jgi:hypothetical protein
MLDCLQLLPFYSSTMTIDDSSTMTTVAVTTLITLGDDRQKFPTTHLEDELVFKEGRDVIGRNQGLGNTSGFLKARYILLNLLEYLD